MDSIAKAQIHHDLNRSGIERLYAKKIKHLQQPRYYGDGKICSSCKKEYSLEDWKKVKRTITRQKGVKTVTITHCGCICAPVTSDIEALTLCDEYESKVNGLVKALEVIRAIYLKDEPVHIKINAIASTANEALNEFKGK